MNTAIATQPWLEEMRQRLRTGEEKDKFQYVSELFQVLQFDQFPGPSLTRAWGHDEWRAWAKDHDFIEDPQERTHSHNFTYAVFPLTFGIAKTTGDWRSSMAVATDLRKKARAWFYNLISIATMLTNPNHAECPKSITEQTTMLQFLRKIVRDSSALGRIMNILSEDKGDKSELMADTSMRLKGTLERIQQEFGISNKQVLMRCELDEETATKLLDRMRIVGNTQIPAMLPGLAKDLLDNLRAQDEEIKAQKRKEREADQIRREQEKTLKAKASTKFKERVEDVRKILATHHASAYKNMTEALARFANLEKSIREVQFPEVPEGVDEIDELRTKAANVDSQLQMKDAAIQVKDQELETARKRIAELEGMSEEQNELIKLAEITNPHKDKYETFLKLTIDKLSEPAFMKLAMNISEVVSQATRELQTLQTTPTTPP